ncbi:Ribosomal protein S18 acetylase RimI [Modestobacter sp. DSM 44400]|uniref:GNAT family N-acetyltransferase n=1 Tax=Modestobacter sp. DSM 44400 TaxID=1550230 RepID=UPI00089A2F77|nr:GNAT family N-acetyltransferase [Modestobacter sp. DSM 44400]SDX79065.1 Ribosomal protein S18 acetylase RimI [Modestobacter sp. DSM 44400]
MSTAFPAALRTATPDDARGIGTCHLACWRETYTGLLSPAFFARRDESRFAANWRRVLEDPHGQTVVVADVDGAVVGFAAAISPSRDDPPVRPLELTTIYLRAAAHGGGLGQALLGSVLGDRPASLWVAEQNPRAIAFYRRNGFAPDGARTELDGEWAGVAEIRLVR